MTGALGLVDEWPVGSRAAGVVRPDGGRQAHGESGAQFRLASVTKLLVGYAMLVAIEEGVVALDDAVGPPGSTLRHLLSHASGTAPDSDAVLARPGTRRIYSNRGFELAGEHLAARSGLPVATYLEEAVLQPLEMRTSALRGSPAHGAVSTVDDLLAFAAELLDPTLVSPDTLREAVTVQFPGLPGVLPGFGVQRPNDWGLAFELRDAKAPHWTGSLNSPGTFGHFGRSGTFLWVDPAARVATVALTDTTFGEWAIRSWPQLSDAVLRGRR